ncbi:MAG: hypothetical protein WAR79_08675 [Melioribacteraceae bacterium]
MLIFFEKYYKNRGERSKIALKNIFLGFGIKGLSIIVNLLMVPIMLNLLGSELFGIWLTLFSIITWFNFFDLGFGHGLRNRLGNTFANDLIIDSKELISTSYFILIIISIVLFLVSLIIIPFLNWQIILNTKNVSNHLLSLIVIFISASFSFNLVLKLITSILLADQRTALTDGIIQSASLISLILLIVLPFFTKVSFTILAVILCFSPLLINLIATLYFFFISKYKVFKPSIKYIRINKANLIFKLGSKFFINQLSSVILFSSINFIIAQVSTPIEVTKYNIVMRYFSIPLLIYGVILNPLWSAVTDASVKSDFNWIKKTLNGVNKIAIGFSIFTIFMLLFSNIVYKIWLNNELNIPLGISIIVTFSTILKILGSSFSTFINGFGKLKLGVYLVLLKDIIFLPMAFYLGNIWGVIGVIIAMILGQIISLIFEPIQIYKLINRKAFGIWSK